MDNSKKNVHSSGPLGMLVKTGQVRKIDMTSKLEEHMPQHVGLDRLKSSTSSYFRTQSGIEFKENELVYIDPIQCESWEYANRSEDEMGEMDELIRSIKENNQLQPALIRTHPNPHDGIKYQIIFGKRRHAACLRLGIPLLVIKKDLLSKQEAIACQDAENKFRKDVSHYSNAKLYQRLLGDQTFKTEKELAETLGLSTSSLNDLMSFNKIPTDLVKLIPDIHSLSISMALKLVQLTIRNKNNQQIIAQFAKEIGLSITSPAKLEKAMHLSLQGKKDYPDGLASLVKTYHAQSGKKLFTLKDQKGAPCIVFSKELIEFVDIEYVCDYFKEYLEGEIGQSNNPDVRIKTIADRMTKGE
jgi:ParB family chromosome partitioning protein